MVIPLANDNLKKSCVDTAKMMRGENAFVLKSTHPLRANDRQIHFDDDND